MTELVSRLVWSTWHLPYPAVVLLLVYIAAWSAILLHELAHALVARVLGVRIWSLTLGRGPLLWDGEWRGCRIRLGVLPLHGAVSLYDADALALGYHDLGRTRWSFRWQPGSSWRAPVISAAGSLANLFAALGVAWYWGEMPRLAAPSHALFATCFTVNLMMYLNLAPIRGLDGWRMAVHARAWRRQPCAAR